MCKIDYRGYGEIFQAWTAIIKSLKRIFMTTTKTNDTSQKLIPIIRSFMVVIAIAYIAATLYHLRFFSPGSPDIAAAIAELIIVAILVAGLMRSRRPVKEALRAMFIALLFSLLITMLGMTIVLLTFSSETMIDLLIHLSALLLIATGFGLSIKATQALPNKIS